MKVTILGCGGSGGVPLIGNDWGACDPKNPKNRRRRVSLLVEQGATNILIDTSPDLREQLLDASISRLSGILYTHDHADHTQGIDDVRFVRENLFDGPAIPTYGSRATLKTLTDRFGYIFIQAQGGSSRLYKPFLHPMEIGYGETFEVEECVVTAFEQLHGFSSRSTGYRIGDIAYSTDAVDFPAASFRYLQNLKLWVVDCLRWEPHLTHAHFDKTLTWIEELKPEKAVLTHLNQNMDYEAVRKRCPENVMPAFDGLEIYLN